MSEANKDVTTNSSGDVAWGEITKMSVVRLSAAFALLGTLVADCIAIVNLFDDPVRLRFYVCFGWLLAAFASIPWLAWAFAKSPSGVPSNLVDSRGRALSGPRVWVRPIGWRAAAVGLPLLTSMLSGWALLSYPVPDAEPPIGDVRLTNWDTPTIVDVRHREFLRPLGSARVGSRVYDLALCSKSGEAFNDGVPIAGALVLRFEVSAALGKGSVVLHQLRFRCQRRQALPTYEGLWPRGVLPPATFIVRPNLEGEEPALYVGKKDDQQPLAQVLIGSEGDPKAPTQVVLTIVPREPGLVSFDVDAVFHQGAKEERVPIVSGKTLVFDWRPGEARRP